MTQVTAEYRELQDAQNPDSFDDSTILPSIPPSETPKIIQAENKGCHSRKRKSIEHPTEPAKKRPKWPEPQFRDSSLALTFAEMQFILSNRRLQELDPVMPNFLTRAHMSCLQRIEALENGQLKAKQSAIPKTIIG